MRKNFLIIVFSFLLTACGFHLRGNESLATSRLPTLYIETQNSYSSFTTQLERTLRANTVKLSTSPKKAITLQILRADFNEQTTSISSGGQNIIYLSTYTVTYQLLDSHDVLIQAPKTVSASRNYSIGTNQVLGDTYVEHSFEAEMQHDVIYQILNQLESNNTLRSLKQPLP